jgi:plasmid replication initiation protein
MSIENLVVRYRNEINRAAHRLTVVEQRILLCAIARAGNQKITDRRTYYVFANDLIELGSDEQSVYSEMLLAVESLLHKRIKMAAVDTQKTLNMLAGKSASGKNIEIREFNWIQEKSRCDNVGRVGIVFSKSLVPLLTELQSQFTRYALIEMKGFTSQYAMRIYPMLAQYRSTGTFIISVDELRECLELKDKFKKFGDFNSRVLKTAIRQINNGACTALKVECTFLKEGRRVTRIRFDIFDKNQDVITQDTSRDTGSNADTEKDKADTKEVKKAKKAKRKPGVLTEKQRNTYADWLLGLNKKKAHIDNYSPDHFISWLCGHKGVSNASMKATREGLVKLLENPEFVLQIVEGLVKVGVKRSALGIKDSNETTSAESTQTSNQPTPEKEEISDEHSGASSDNEEDTDQISKSTETVSSSEQPEEDIPF